MNKRAILIYLSLTAAPFIASLASAAPILDSKGIPANTTCRPKVNAAGAADITQPVLHFDKIIFAITDKLQAVNPDEQSALEKIPFNTELDIKVKDDPRTVADLKGKVLSFLGAVSNPQFYPAIRIIDVEYGVVICPK